tara:strand:+ start:574 stop:915 length:342 start_codon:yes stop_codon:yes gene_type:complete
MPFIVRARSEFWALKSALVGPVAYQLSVLSFPLSSFSSCGKAEEKVDMQRKAKSNKHLKWGLIIWFSTVPRALNSLFNGWDRVGRNNLTEEPVRQAKAKPTTTDIEKDGKTLL